MTATDSRQPSSRARPVIQRLAAILWPSFIWAGVASMVLFAFADPVDLHAISFPDWQLSRTAGYSIGFLMFWSVTAASSFGTWLLLRDRKVLNQQHQQPTDPSN